MERDGPSDFDTERFEVGCLCSSGCPEQMGKPLIVKSMFLVKLSLNAIIINLSVGKFVLLLLILGVYASRFEHLSKGLKDD